MKLLDLWKFHVLSKVFWVWAGRSPVFNRKNFCMVAYLHSTCPSLGWNFSNFSQKKFGTVVITAFYVSWWIFSRSFSQDKTFFIRTVFKNWKKFFRRLKRFYAWLSKLHSIFSVEQLEVIFLSKIKSNNFFWSLNKKNFWLLSKSSRPLSACPEVQFEGFFLEQL